MLGEYSVAKAAQLSLSRLYADRYAGDGVLVNAICPGLVRSELWTDEGGLLDQSRGEKDRDEALASSAASRPIPRFAEVEEIASAITFLSSERASLRRRLRVERRRRRGPGDHLSVGTDPARELSSLLLDPAEAAAMQAHGRDDAAVLAAIYDWPTNPGLILTERRHDMRRHAGEVSFPGGRADPGETAVECALREAQEEIGLDPDVVRGGRSPPADLDRRHLLSRRPGRRPDPGGPPPRPQPA